MAVLVVSDTYGLSTALLLLLVVLAGCVGGEDIDLASQEIPDAADAAFDQETGALEGYILDDESLPVKAATVGLRELDVQTLSDSDGRFTFSNLAPATYIVDVQRLGYHSELRRVDIQAGGVTNLQISVRPIVVNSPYHQVWSETGFFDCSYTGVVGTTPCAYGYYDWPDSTRRWWYPAEAGSMSVFHELTWDPGTFATGSTLQMHLSYEARPSSHHYCHAVGESPVVLHWQRDAGDEDDGECLSGGNAGSPTGIDIDGEQLTSFVNSGPGEVAGQGTAGVGAAVQQEFEVWFSIFYWGYAPEDYSALPDA